MSRPTVHSLISGVVRGIDRAAPARTVHAHCDIPCGIYDPHLMQLGALTVIRMNQLIGALEGTGQAQSHSFTRYTLVKEEHAEIVKRETRIIMGDYFKQEHVEKYPELFGLVFNIMKTASKARQNIDMAAAEELLGLTNRFAEIFWETKGIATKKQASNQAAGGEYIVPAN